MSKRTRRRSSSDDVLTIGIDHGDRWGHYCVLDAQGDVAEEGRVRMTRTALSAHFSGPGARVAIETGSQSAWVNDHLRGLGHEVIVANARELRAISGSNSKHDAADAEKLARYARVDPRILHPIQHRDLDIQKDLVQIRARAAAVRGRTQMINAVRGMVKSFGFRLPDCSTRFFGRRYWSELPRGLRDALQPLFVAIETVSLQIKEYEQRIEHMARQSYPERKSRSRRQSRSNSQRPADAHILKRVRLGVCPLATSRKIQPEQEIPHEYHRYQCHRRDQHFRFGQREV